MEELESIFPPMLKDICNVDHLMASTRAVMMELAWLGVRGEIVAAQLQLYCSIMLMKNDRPQRQHLCTAMSRAISINGEIQTPEKYPLPCAHRLMHYLPAVQCTRTIPKGCKPLQALEQWRVQAWHGLQLGPKRSGVEYIAERAWRVAGYKPSVAIGRQVSTAKGKGRYTWGDLAWDVQHQFLVIPAWECLTLPQNYDRTLAVNAAERKTRQSAGNANEHMRRNYWRLKPAATHPKKQQAAVSPFAISILHIFREIAGERAVDAVSKAAVAVVSKTELKDTIQLAARRAVARIVWTEVRKDDGDRQAMIRSHYTKRRLEKILSRDDADLIVRGLLHRAQGVSSGGEQNTKAHPRTVPIPGAWGKERTEERDRVHEPLVGATDPSAHLMRIPISGRARETEACPYNVTRARVGALALTTTVDEYVKQGMDDAPSFCVCCQLQGGARRFQETLAHHLMGHCTRTKAFSDAALAVLRKEMRDHSQQWTQDYDAAQTEEERTALVLAASDEFHRNGAEGQHYVAEHVCKWIQFIRDNHPLCRAQMGGALVHHLSYRQAHYAIGEWHGFELQALQHRAGNTSKQLTEAVPSRSLRQIKHKIRELRGDADADIEQHGQQRLERYGLRQVQTVAGGGTRVRRRTDAQEATTVTVQQQEAFASVLQQQRQQQDQRPARQLNASPVQMQMDEQQQLLALGPRGVPRRAMPDGTFVPVYPQPALHRHPAFRRPCPDTSMSPGRRHVGKVHVRQHGGGTRAVSPVTMPLHVERHVVQQQQQQWAQVVQRQEQQMQGQRPRVTQSSDSAKRAASTGKQRRRKSKAKRAREHNRGTGHRSRDAEGGGGTS